MQSRSELFPGRYRSRSLRPVSIVIALPRTTACLCLFGTPAFAAQSGASGSAPTRWPEGITPAAAKAIERGLAYLASHQDRQGAWSNQGGYGAYPVAMTSLAGLALLMDGNTTTQGRHAPQVDRAAKYVLRSASANGMIGRMEYEPRPMYGHGFGMLFLSQLYGMTEDADRASQIHGVLSRGVELTTRAQSREGGWIYTPTSGGDEGSVTITQVQALRSCRNVGVAVPKETIDQAMGYLARSQNSDGGIRYSVRQRGGTSRVPITAAAVCCWFNAGEYDNPRALRALEYARGILKPNTRVGGHDFYAHLYLAQALYVSSDDSWNDYFAKRRDYLLMLQRQDGSWQGDGVGRVYGTALAVTILSLPYERVPLYMR